MKQVVETCPTGRSEGVAPMQRRPPDVPPLQGSVFFLHLYPGLRPAALPWADMSCPFRATGPKPERAEATGSNPGFSVVNARHGSIHRQSSAPDALPMFRPFRALSFFCTCTQGCGLRPCPGLICLALPGRPVGFHGFERAFGPLPPGLFAVRRTPASRAFSLSTLFQCHPKPVPCSEGNAGGTYLSPAEHCRPVSPGPAAGAFR